MEEKAREDSSLIKTFLEANLLQELGDGTENNPFLVSDVDTFNGIRNNLSACYRLTADIDLEGTPMSPMESFTGVLDGDGHVIRNFKIASGADYTGLFRTAIGATFRNLGMEDGQVIQTSSNYYTGALAGQLNSCTMEDLWLRNLTVSGMDYTGALAGTVSGGSVSRCCVMGTVTGSASVGGLTGSVNGGEVRECCAIGTVTGTLNVGGLIGGTANSAVISDSYASGSVTSTTNRTSTGGLVGNGNNVSIRNCYAACCVSPGASGLVYGYSNITVTDSYFDRQVATAGVVNTYNVGKLTSALLRKEFFGKWDFEEVWNIAEGSTYPYLRGAGGPGDAVDAGHVSAGAGTEAAPYLIGSTAAFRCISYEPSGSYRLTADIDLEGAPMSPMESFTGVLDGDGHVIKNVKISSTAASTGLFRTATGATFRNLGMEGGEVTQTSTYSYTGALAGQLTGCTMENLWLRNLTVSGKEYTGALAGRVSGGSVSGCCAIGTVTGTIYVGGLIGGMGNSAVISDSYAGGGVTSTTNNTYTGGLVGYAAYSGIKNCYAACRVSTGARGLVSADSTTTVTDSCFDRQVATAGVVNTYNVGKLTSALLRREFFGKWDFEEVWNIAEGSTYPYLRGAGGPGDAVDAGHVSAGAGTEAAPYLIGSTAAFRCISYEPSGSYRLTADIDLEGAPMSPMESFTGVLDGDGHVIKNVKISSTAASTGLFRTATGATFRNLGMEDGEVTQTSTYSYTGALAGQLNSCTMENLWLRNLAVTGKSYTGGLAGSVSGGSVRGCGTTSNVTGTEYVGGLIGQTVSNAVIKDSYARGSVMSTTNASYAGGLVGYASSSKIEDCYAACRVSTKASGLVYVYSNSTVMDSYFDSLLAATTTPSTQARTTEQMLSKDTYTGWDFENTWNDVADSYPTLKIIDLISQEPFTLIFRNLTSFSVTIEWPSIPGTKSYDLLYSNKRESSTVAKALIEGLTPDTDYEFRVRANILDTVAVWSRTLRIRTKKILSVNGLHSTNKGIDSIALAWNPVEEAESYEVICNGSIQKINTNTCTITELYADTPYVIRVKALLDDGRTITSNPITEKIYALNPQTDYAKEFIEKCESQVWFMDEIENLLNLKGKSINTINSQKDFATIYAIGLADRGVSGKIPAGIGELFQLQYLYLANNDLGGELPDELYALDKLVVMDLFGNNISD